MRRRLRLINHSSIICRGRAANRHKFHIAVPFRLVCTFLHLSRVKLNGLFNYAVSGEHEAPGTVETSAGERNRIAGIRVNVRYVQQRRRDVFRISHLDPCVESSRLRGRFQKDSAASRVSRSSCTGMDGGR